MTEEFLHYIWKYRLFDQLDLKTTAGEIIEIIKVGDHNFDAGPDFFNAKIKVGNTLWAGKIRMYFIYLSFFTVRSPIILYFVMAFILEHKKYFKPIRNKRRSVWDL